MNANENINPNMQNPNEEIVNEQPVVPENPVQPAPAEPAPEVLEAMPPLPSQPTPLTPEETAPMAGEELPDALPPIDEAQPVAAAADVAAADALEAQLQQQRAQSQHRRSAGPQVRPIHFSAQRQNVIHNADPSFRYIDEAEQEKRRRALDLYQSFNSKRYLQGSVKGVRPVFERGSGVANNQMLYYAIVSYGPYQVYIPDFKFSDIDQEALLRTYQNNNPERTMADAMRIYLQSRIGAKIDFVVDQLPEEGDLENHSVVGGDRKEAMRRKRIQYWFGTTNTGAPYVNEGDKALARIVAVSRGAVRVELYGVETAIPARELSWSMLQDARSDDRFEVGKQVKVLITEIKRNEEQNYAVSYQASVKQAENDPRIAAMNIYTDGSFCEGVITYVDPPRADRPNGRIFVELEKGVQCMCPMLNGPIPPIRGTLVRVRITNHNDERHFLYAKIERVLRLPADVQL